MDTQAIILAAGMGSRLASLTQENTKCMVKVNGESLIQRLLNKLDKCNLSQIIIVTGYKSSHLEQYITSLNIKTKIIYIENEVYDSTNNIYSLLLAKEYMKNHNTLLFESDLILEDKIIEKMLDSKFENLAVVAKYEDFMDGTVACIDENSNITDLVSKSSFDKAKISEYYKTVNIYKFSKEFSSKYYIAFLETYMNVFGVNKYYEEALKIITALDKSLLKALVLSNEKWYEIDTPFDLNEAEKLFSS